MSLYNMLHGVNPVAGAVLNMLKLTPDDVGRFRDAFITADGKLAIYTRNGGGNREEYDEVFEDLANHPEYLYDEDDDFDCTYATIYFNVPLEFKDDVKQFLKLVEEKDAQVLTQTPAEKFQETLDNLSKHDD